MWKGQLLGLVISCVLTVALIGTFKLNGLYGSVIGFILGFTLTYVGGEINRKLNK